MSKPVIALKGVEARIGGRVVLSAIDWEVKSGESWAVAGPNGAGKTTLLSIINGYRWPTKGEVSVLGRKFGKTDLRELRKELGMVSAYLDEWIDSRDKVRDVVISGKHGSTHLWNQTSEDDEIEAERLLRLVGCQRYVDRTMGELSQGERQKVLISRALMSRPKLLTLDEPCEGLDLKSREIFLSTLSALARRREIAMIDVTHRTDEIPQGFTHAFLLKGGNKIAAGPIERVLNGANLSGCFGVQVKVRKIGNRYYTII